MADENIMTADDYEYNDDTSTGSLNGLALKSRDGYAGKLFLPSTADVATLNQAQADITSAQAAVNSIDPTARFITSLTSEAEPDTADDGKILLLVDCPPYIDSPVTMGTDLITGNPDLPEFYTADITPCIKSTKEPVGFTVNIGIQLTLSFSKPVSVYQCTFKEPLDLFTLIVSGNGSIANSFYTDSKFDDIVTSSVLGTRWYGDCVFEHTYDDYESTFTCTMPTSMPLNSITERSVSSDTWISTLNFTIGFAPSDVNLCVPCGGVDIIPAFYDMHATGSHRTAEITMNICASSTASAVNTTATADAVFMYAPIIEYDI